jgi:hypothetical protein
LAQPYKDLEGHTGPVNAMAFSPQSNYLLSVGSDRQAILWTIPYGKLESRLIDRKERRQVITAPQASINAIALEAVAEDSSHQVFWVASSDGQLYEAVLYTPTHGHDNNALILKRAVNLSRRLTKSGPPLYWESLALHPRRPTVYVLSRFGQLVAWDKTEDWIQSFTDTAGVSYALVIPKHGKALYLGSGSGSVYVLDPEELSVKKVLRGHRDGVRGLALSYDDRLLASAGLDGRVMVWQLPEGLRIRTLEGHRDGVRAVAFSPDGRYLVSAGRDGLLILWDVATGRQEKVLELAVPLWCAAFSPNGQYLVAGGNDGSLRLWRIDQMGIRPAQILTERDELYKPPVALEDDIPLCTTPKPHRYAYVISNEDYRSYQPTFTPAMNVPYAVRDAYAFRMYAEQVWGVPPQNIVFLQNATSAQMRRELEKILILAQASRGTAEIFFYYAGHGVPHPDTKESYLLPVDASPRRPEEGGLRMTDLVKQLSESGAKRVWMVVDACFSGGARYESPLASRGIRIKPKPIQMQGPVILLSASSADQESLPYHQAQHGIFTYFFLKALRESCGRQPLTEFFEKVRVETARYSLLLHERLQEPSLLLSPALPEAVLQETW